MISPSNPSGQLASIQPRIKSFGMGLKALVSALPPVLIHLIPSNLSVTWQGNCIFVSPAIYVAALIGFVINERFFLFSGIISFSFVLPLQAVSLQLSFQAHGPRIAVVSHLGPRGPFCRSPGWGPRVCRTRSNRGPTSLRLFQVV